MRCKVVIDEREIEIGKRNAGAKYPIYWDGLPIGYVALLSNEQREEIWCGSTAILDKFAAVIGGYILRSDCSFDEE